MSIVKVLLRPSHIRSVLRTNEEILDLATRHFKEYQALDKFVITEESQEAAEYVFELTNNPSREEERLGMYGPHRSVAVGDIVEVEDRGCLEHWVCMPVGWEPIFVSQNKGERPLKTEGDYSAIYQEMQDKYNRGELTESEWHEFCTKILERLLEVNKDVLVTLKEI